MRASRIHDDGDDDDGSDFIQGEKSAGKTGDRIDDDLLLHISLSHA